MKKSSLQKKDISSYISKKKGISFLYSKKIVDDLINIFFFNLKLINIIHLKNIGTLKLINKKPRLGRNPKTKENFIIKERISIIFKTSKNLQKNLNI